jgi:hypothetical protein
MRHLTPERTLALVTAIHNARSDTQWSVGMLLKQCAGDEAGPLAAAVVGCIGRRPSRIKLGICLQKLCDAQHGQFRLEGDYDRHDHAWHYRVRDMRPQPLSGPSIVEQIEADNARREHNILKHRTPSRFLDALERDQRRCEKINKNIAKMNEQLAADAARQEIRDEARERREAETAERAALDREHGPELIVTYGEMFLSWERAGGALKALAPYARFVDGERGRIEVSLGRGVDEQRRRYKHLKPMLASLQRELHGVPAEVLIEGYKPGASKNPKDYIDHSSRRAYVAMGGGGTPGVINLKPWDVFKS